MTQGIPTSGRSGIRGKGRERLIGAAASCYSKGGGGSMTINRVCQEADVSVGTIYHHFPRGIPDLEGQLYLDTLVAYQDGFLTELTRHRSASAGVKAMVHFHLEWMASNLSLAHFLRFYSASWLSSEHIEQLDRMNARFGHAAEEWRRPHVKAGEVRDVPGVLFWALVLAPAHQLGGEIIATSQAQEAAGAIRRAGAALAEGAWLATRGSGT